MHWKQCDLACQSLAHLLGGMLIISMKAKTDQLRTVPQIMARVHMKSLMSKARGSISV